MANKLVYCVVEFAYVAQEANETKRFSFIISQVFCLQFSSNIRFIRFVCVYAFIALLCSMLYAVVDAADAGTASYWTPSENTG